jgi:hypothetical protein
VNPAHGGGVGPDAAVVPADFLDEARYLDSGVSRQIAQCRPLRDW